ncbi:MAG TPA: HD domain-containing protein, partial [Planctomycetaceae bacterium]|nr:HD domain-containing protein [Planctomycetaceae bacterium]
VQRYHLAYPDAETLGPTLLAYLTLARRFNLEELWVSDVNLRDGVLQEMALGDVWTEDFRRQVIRFALTLARRYHVDEQHARQTAELARRLFQHLAPLHRLESRYGLVLYLAALLHEIGAYVNHRSLHKHTMYLIRNSEMFGLGQKDQLLVALVARYHRRASPQPSHEGYSTLGREDRITVSKLAAILRIAIALDESRSGRVQELSCEIDDDRVIIYLHGVEDLALEQLAVRQQGTLFDEIFGRSVLLRRAQS